MSDSLKEVLRQACKAFHNAEWKTEVQFDMMNLAVQAIAGKEDLRKAATFFHDAYSVREDKTPEQIRSLKELMEALLQ